MRVLVIGGSGFIGSHVVDGLIASGHRVRVFDRQGERFRPPLKGVEYQFGTFGDRMAVIEALSGIDVVMHLVSTTFPGTANLDPKADVRDNLVASIALMEAMRDLGTPRLVFLSSGGTVYGIPQTVPIPEDHPLRPINSYGIVKVAIESYIDMFRRIHGISAAVIRASNPYGPRQSHSGVQGVVSTFLRRVEAGEPIEIWGDGSVVRDYLFVADLAGLCVRAAETSIDGAFNAGSGTGTSLSEIVTTIGTITGADLRPVYKPGRPVDAPVSVLDVTRAREAFGWTAQTPLVDGMRATWAWMQDSRA